MAAIDQALFEAAKTGKLNDVIDCITNGADVNASNSFMGWTSLHVACGFNTKLELVDYLILSGADVNKADNNGRRPIHMVAKGHKNDIVLRLLEAGCDVNVQNNSGMTASHFAAVSNSFECLEILMANGADLNIKDGKGMTVADSAEDRGNDRIVALCNGDPIPEEQVDPQLQSLNALLGGITQLTDLKQGAVGQAQDAGIDTAALISQLRGNLAAGRSPQANITSRPQPRKAVAKRTPKQPTSAGRTVTAAPQKTKETQELRVEVNQLKQKVNTQEEEIATLKGQVAHLMWAFQDLLPSDS